MRVRASGWATKLRPCSDDAARTPACVAPLLGGSQWRGAASKECTRAGALRRQRMPGSPAKHRAQELHLFDSRQELSRGEKRDLGAKDQGQL